MQGDNILILDDEQNILNSLKRLFRDDPIKVYTTTDFEEAMNILQSVKIKLVLSDHRMPEVTGIDFLTMVKEKHPLVIRILFTGYLDIGVAEDAINKSGVYRFINKPWNEEELKSAVFQGIERFNLQEENMILNDAIKKQNAELIEVNTKLKNMYESQKAFTSTLSHELRTPIASTKTAIDTIHSGSVGDLNEKQEQFINEAITNLEKLNQLIDDILDLSKLESGKTSLHIEPNDLHQLIKDIIEIQNPIAQKKGLSIQTDLCPDIPNIPFDKSKMNQIFNNLLNNAMKYTDKGTITIRTKLKSEVNNIEISVQDTGKGIKPHDMDKLFKKFQQFEDTHPDDNRSSGLGLAICKEIVYQHRGKIWAESELGQGSTFYFILPLIERRAREPIVEKSKNTIDFTQQNVEIADESKLNPTDAPSIDLDNAQDIVSEEGK